MFPTDVYPFKRDVSRTSIFVSVKVPNCGTPKRHTKAHSLCSFQNKRLNIYPNSHFLWPSFDTLLINLNLDVVL